VNKPPDNHALAIPTTAGLPKLLPNSTFPVPECWGNNWQSKEIYFAVKIAKTFITIASMHD
jgi:hypothetical protein